MALTRIIIDGYKSIGHCDISLSTMNVLLGENGSGKTNLLEAIAYFYSNLTEIALANNIFDENNRLSNEVRIALVYDLSEFVKISKSNADEVPDLFDDSTVSKAKYAGYYKAIISMASRSKTNQIRVELSQIKGGPIQWNLPYEDRFIFKSLFPVFLINTRDLDIAEWGRVWDILGELGKVSYAERKNLETRVSEMLLDKSKEISGKLRDISAILQASDVSIKPATSKDFAKNLSKVFFSGDTIQQSGKRLDYFSTGTNSVKYVELLLRTIDEISRLKLKEPIVLFDEPEISLHTKFVDELASTMLDTSTKLCLMVSTHSARLVKNLIVRSTELKLFDVKLLDKHTLIRNMKKFAQYSPASRYRVTDDHINAYFSRAIVFVEGESELELFSNPYLQKLFPSLINVDVFQAMTQKPILNIMNPDLLRTQTPYICLIDMDKVLKYDRTTKKFSLKSEYISKDNKEILQYRNKHQKGPYLFHQHQRVAAMAEKLHIHYYLPYLSCDDQHYHQFISALKQYLLAYNVFVLDTTIEGTLINRKSQSFAMEFLSKRAKEQDYSAFTTYLETLGRTDQINCLRMVFNGKSDLIQTWKTISKGLPQDTKLLIEKVSIGDKTSWISDYLDEFFCKNGDGADSVKSFQKYIQDEGKRKILIKQFQYMFPELYLLIDLACKMI